MSKKKLLIYLSCLVTLLGIILFCLYFQSDNNDLKALNPNIYDQSWLTGQPCSAPCWQGIEPGVTSRDDVITKVKDLPFIDKNNVNLSTTGASFLCKYPRINSQSCVAISFNNNNILQILWLTPNYPITFEQVVDYLGPPDGFSLGPVDPGATACYLGLIWKERQLIIEHTAPKPFLGDDLCIQIIHNDQKIPHNLIVEGVVIAMPDYIERAMDYKVWKGFADK